MNPSTDLSRLPVFRTVAVVVLASGVVAGCDRQQVSSASPSRGNSDSVSVIRLADTYLARYAATFPEVAVAYGLTEAPTDRFTDNSLAANERWVTFEDSVWAAMQAIEEPRLTGTAAEIVLAQLREALEISRSRRVCRQELWPIGPLSGWQASWAQLASLQAVGTPEARSAALQRWRAAGRYLDTERANLEAGLTAGYTAAAPSTRAALEQIDELLALPLDSLPFMALARGTDDTAFRAAFRSAISDSLLPAARRYRDFVRSAYLPRAKPAVTDNPNGAECYRSLLRAATGVDVDPQQLVQQVTSIVRADSIELLARAMAVYPNAPDRRARDAMWLRTMIDQDSTDLLPTADSVVAFTRAVIERARAALPRAFSDVPDVEVVLEPFPDYQQASAPAGGYVPAAEDGSRPAIYHYRTHPPVHRIGLAATVVHETWPGHHLQFAIANRRPRHRIALLAPVPSFVEGWGQYTEHLAEELGIYSHPRDRLAIRYFAAPLLLADVRMNARGWSAADAERYLVGAMPDLPRQDIPGLVAILANAPGYAASYTVGALELRRLRDEAERALGSQFDLRAFHNVVLGEGAVPLSLVRTRVERWLKEESQATSGKRE